MANPSSEQSGSPVRQNVVRPKSLWRRVYVSAKIGRRVYGWWPGDHRDEAQRVFEGASHA